MDKIRLTNILVIILLVMVVALVVMNFIKKDYVVNAEGQPTSQIKSGYFGKVPGSSKAA